VISHDWITGRNKAAPVLARKDKNNINTWKIAFSDNINPLITTRYHSFLTARGWIRTDKLKPGDKLHANTGTGVQTPQEVASAKPTGESALVHNLITAERNTYIANGCVVHSFTFFRWFQSLFYNLCSGMSKRFSPMPQASCDNERV